ncbi:MAG: RNA methyltransferase [Anaerolineaceae bacterium]
MITSPSNPRIKMLRKLQLRKYREESGSYYLEGPRHVLEALTTSAPIDYVVICPELLTNPESILSRINAQLGQDQILVVREDTFKGFSTKDGPKGLAAVVRQVWASLTDIKDDECRWVALSSVANPGNLGTIIRTCDAVGLTGIILLDQSTDPYDPTALRASMGTNFAIKHIKTGFNELVDWKRSNNIALIGTSDRAELDYHHASYPRKFILLMGSEREGLNPEQMKQCDLMVRIPMRGQADSLNLAVATSVILYEMYNQMQDKL